MENKLDKKLIWIYILSASVYATQGFEGLPGLSLFLFLKEHLGFSAEKVMYIGSITGIAWLIKPLYGYLCDNYLSKKSWMLLSLLGSILIALYFGLSAFLPISLLVLFLSIGNFNSALRDVSVDGIMCVDGKETGNCDKIQAVQWTAITIASIAVGLGGGYIAEHFSYRMAYLCLIPIYLIIGVIVFNYNKSKYDINFIKGYILGLLDGEGSIGKNMVVIVNTDKNIIDTCSYFLNELKIIHIISERKIYD